MLVGGSVELGCGADLAAISTMPTTCPSLRDAIRKHRAAIIATLTSEIERQNLAPRPLPRQELLDHLGEVLDTVCASLSGTDPEVTAATARKHAAQRRGQGFEVSALVREYGVLEKVIVDATAEPALSRAEYDALGEAIHFGAAAAVDEFVRQRDEQMLLHTRELDQANAVLQTLLMTAPLGFALFDRAMRFRIVNARLAEMNGVSPNDHIGKTPGDVMPQLDMDLLTGVHQHVLETGESKTIELVTATAATGGRVHSFAEHWYPVKTHEQTIGVGVLVEDVTELRAASLFRERILGVVSHDLRSPLQAIATAAALLSRKHAQTPDANRLAEAVMRGVRRMVGIIDQLFDYIRLDQEGKLPLERERVDVAEIARRVIDESELASGRKGAVALRVSGDAHADVDGARLEQVITNLVRNAIEHGGGRAELRVSGDGGELVIDVVNTGPPIPDEMRERIFEPFRSEARKAGHLGLGLYIAREIVRSHGGSLTVSSREGETIFRVRLPPFTSGT